MRIYPLLNSSSISQQLHQCILTRGLNANITDRMDHNSSSEATAECPIYDYLWSCHTPIIDAKALNSSLVVRRHFVA